MVILSFSKPLYFTKVYSNSFLIKLLPLDDVLLDFVRLWLLYNQTRRGVTKKTL